MLLGLGGCVAGLVLGALGEAKFRLFQVPSSEKVKVATYREQQISNEVMGRTELLLLPVEMRRQLKELEVAETAMRDRALGLKTMDELEAAKKEYYLMQERRQLAQNFILQQRAGINERSVLLDFIAGQFGAEFPVILEAEAYDQLKSNFTGAFGAGVEVTDLTVPVIGALQDEIDGRIPPEVR
jgi:hypothetical protein